MSKIDKLIEKYSPGEAVKITLAGTDIEVVERNGVKKDLEQLKSSLPQPVEVPEFVAEWIEKCQKNATLAECLNGSYPTTGEHCEIISEDEDWIITGNNEELLARAWLDGYTVVKEPLYYVKVGNLTFVDWRDGFVAELAITDDPEWTNYAHKIPTKKGADRIAKIIGGEVVPVGEEAE